MEIFLWKNTTVKNIPLHTIEVRPVWMLAGSQVMRSRIVYCICACKKSVRLCKGGSASCGILSQLPESIHKIQCMCILGRQSKKNWLVWRKTLNVFSVCRSVSRILVNGHSQSVIEKRVLWLSLCAMLKIAASHFWDCCLILCRVTCKTGFCFDKLLLGILVE